MAEELEGKEWKGRGKLERRGGESDWEWQWRVTGMGRILTSPPRTFYFSADRVGNLSPGAQGGSFTATGRLRHLEGPTYRFLASATIPKNNPTTKFVFAFDADVEQQTETRATGTSSPILVCPPSLYPKLEADEAPGLGAPAQAEVSDNSDEDEEEDTEGEPEFPLELIRESLAGEGGSPAEETVMEAAGFLRLLVDLLLDEAVAVVQDRGGCNIRVEDLARLQAAYPEFHLLRIPAVYECHNSDLEDEEETQAGTEKTVSEDSMATTLSVSETSASSEVDEEEDTGEMPVGTIRRGLGKTGLGVEEEAVEATVSVLQALLGRLLARASGDARARGDHLIRTGDLARIQADDALFKYLPIPPDSVL